jgi:phage/plasmid primase, P4 family, C-terminal domain
MYVEFVKGMKFPTRNPEYSDFLDSFEDAGHVIEGNEVIVDIDNFSHEFCRTLIDFFGITTKTVWTDRGVHLYFNKVNSKLGKKTGICALGIPIELKNKTNKYITVKRNGIARKVENEDIKMNFPEMFNIKSYDNLSELDEGDGRNNALFKHWKKLLKSTVENKEEIIRFISEHVFPTALPLKEVENILKNDSSDERISNDEQQQVDAINIINKYKCVKYQATLFFKNGENYSNDIDEFNYILSNYVLGNKSATYIENVKKLIMMKTRTIHQDDMFIQFKNGILKNGEFIEIVTDEFTPYRINVNYNSNAPVVNVVDEYLHNLCNNEENYIKHVLEAIASSFILDVELKRHLSKFWLFYGDGGNGKGTLLTIIRKILDDDNCSSLDLFDLKDDRKITSAVGKLANLGDDVSAKKAMDDETTKRLKNITSADSIEFRPLYSNPKKAIISPTLIFTTNKIIKTWEKGNSIKRRIIWCPMLYKPQTKDPKFISKLTTTEALEYWIKLLVEAYQRLYQNKQFTDSKTITDFTEQYHSNNDPVENFVSELNVFEDIIGKTLADLRELYLSYVDDTDSSAPSFPRSRLKEAILIKYPELEYKKIRLKSNDKNKYSTSFVAKNT